MTEPKRIPFTTVNTSEKDSKSEKDPPTIRFTLSLDVSNEQQCTEYSYADLLKKSLGEKKTVQNGNDPFGEDEDQEALAAIAKKFEEKYKPKGTAKWKQKHGRIQDLVDLGEGYDETDDFIDNTEAYDEVVPACLTTKLGGFYINSGKLDFKEISDDSDDDFKLGTLKKKKKKRKIESDSESDGEKKEQKIKKRKLKDGMEVGEKKRKKILNGGGKEFKKPKNPDKAKKKMSPTVADLLKQQSESTGNELKENGRITPDGNSQSSHDGNTSSQDEAIDSVIDSVIAMSKNDKLDAVFDSVIGMTDSNSRDNDEKRPESAPKLPEGLKAEFMEILDKLKGEARNSSVGKGKFFSDEVNEMLLDVELTTRQIPCSQRSAIFGHLALFLPCTKDTLLKRAKKLRLNRQDDQLKGPVERLKDAIAAVIPEQIKKHDVEIQIWKQKQAENETIKEDNKPDGKEGDTEDSEEEGEKTNNTEPTKKKVAAPKKKFEWNENLRTLLCEVVRVKMKIYDYMKTRTQSAEEYLRTFLDREIRPLWPKGWMQTSVLFKESRPGHVAWTNPTKIKKVPMTNKTVNSASNTPSGITKPGTTPITTPLTVTKQGATPVSAPLGTNSQKPIVIPSNTPVRPLAAGDASRIVPTLLDYAGEKSAASKVKSATEKLKEQAAATGSSSASSLGLSILASSAASHKYIGEKSWDHAVSDILRQTDNKKDSSFLQQFQNYASSVFQHQLGKEDPKTSPTKSQQPLTSPQSSLQIKPQDAQAMVHKLKVAQMSKPPTPQAHLKQVTNAQLAAYLTQKTTSGNLSTLQQDAYKHILENRDKQFSPSQVGEGKPKTTTAQRVNKVKTIIVQTSIGSNNPTQSKTVLTKFSPPSNSSSSKKPVLVRSISQGSVSMQMANQVHGQKISPTSINISGQRVSPLVSPGAQRQSPSKSSVSYHSPNSVSHLANASKGEATATTLLQSLFQIDQGHAKQKSPSPSGTVNRSTPTQNKTSASPIWSMNSIVQQQQVNIPAKTSPSYSLPGLPKPVPGYQSIKLSNFKETGAPVGMSTPHSPTMKSLLHTTLPQGISGHSSSSYVPTSPLLPGQQGNNLPQQTGFFPPYTTQQSSYSYGPYYTGKSSNSSSHGY